MKYRFWRLMFLNHSDPFHYEKVLTPEGVYVRLFWKIYWRPFNQKDIKEKIFDPIRK